jgi:outer membrane protein OmpA-like peptidoglycan-associated protein
MQPKPFLMKHLPLILLFSLIPCFYAAADTVSTSGVQFLKIPPGVRGAGMGGMFTAVADDVSTTYWNMAGLGQIQNIEINLLHIAYFADTNYEFGGLAVPIRPGSVLGLGAYMDFIPAFNSTGNPSATVGSANDVAIAIGFAQKFGDYFTVGLGGKIISSNLATSSALGEAVDAGLLVHTKGREFTLGLAAQNIGQFSNFTQFTANEKLPQILRGGVAYRYQPLNPTNFLVGVDVEKPVDSDYLVRAGAEVWLGNDSFSAAFRGGYSLSPQNGDLGGYAGASLGAGVRFSNFELDYALVPLGLLGDTHRFSVTYRFIPGPEQPSSAAKPREKIVQIQINPQMADFKAGTIKQATFDIRPQARTEIKNWTLEITDPRGNVIKTITGLGVPPKQIVWDGRDERGNIVLGGVGSNYNFRTVDMRGQQDVSSEPLVSATQMLARERQEEGAQEAQGGRTMVLPEAIQPGLTGLVKVSVPFGKGSYYLSREVMNYLDRIAKLIREKPECKVYLDGHAYNEGTPQNALAISQNRADAVMRYLVERGQVSPESLYSRGHGDSAPLDKSDTQAARDKNRRVDIIIMTK